MSGFKKVYVYYFLAFIIYLILTGIVTRFLFIKIVFELDNIRLMHYLAGPLSIAIFLLLFLIFKRSISTQLLVIMGLIMQLILITYGLIVNPDNITTVILPYIVINSIFLLTVFLLLESYIIAALLLFFFGIAVVFSLNEYVAQQFHSQSLNYYERNDLFQEEIHLIDLYQIDGNSINQDCFEGKIVLLSFWSHYCRDYSIKSKYIDKIYCYFNEREDVSIVSVFAHDWPFDEKLFLYLNDLNFKEKNKHLLLLDKNGAFRKSLGVSTLPCEVLIDKQKRIVNSYVDFFRIQGNRYVNYNIKIIKGLLND